MSHDGITWVEEYPGFSEGYCIAFARGLSAPELLDRMGCDVRASVMLTPAEAAQRMLDSDGFMLGSKHGIIRAGESQGWGFAIEEFSGQALDADVLAAVSEGTVALAFFSNGSLRAFSYAEAGRHLWIWEPGYVVDPDHIPTQLVPPLTAVGLTAADGQVVEYPDAEPEFQALLALSMASRQFGVALTPQDVAGSLLAAPRRADDRGGGQ